MIVLKSKYKVTSREAESSGDVWAFDSRWFEAAIYKLGSAFNNRKSEIWS